MTFASHWETWVLKSEQEVNHSTLEMIARKMERHNNPMQDITVTQGAYDTYGYGVEWGMNDDMQTRYWYTDTQGQRYEFTPSEWQKYIKEVQKPKNAVVPKGFKVSEQTSGPWMDHEEVDKGAMDILLGKYGKPVTKSDM